MLQALKQISKMEEKSFTSSLKNCPERRDGPEPEFVNISRAQESIPRNRFLGSLIVYKIGLSQGVTKRCRLSWLTNNALAYEPKCGRGGLAGSQPMSTAVHRSPHKLWRSHYILNLWAQLFRGYFIKRRRIRYSSLRVSFMASGI